MDWRQQVGGYGLETAGGRLWTGDNKWEVMDWRRQVGGYGLERAGGRLWTGDNRWEVMDWREQVVFPKIKCVSYKTFTIITLFLFAEFHAVALEKFWQFLIHLQSYTPTVRGY
jgi:hypothetical protein